MQSFCKWAIPTVDEQTGKPQRGVMFIFSQFLVQNQQFWVINGHMPIDEEEKLHCVRWLNANVDQEVGGNDQLVFYGGDQNTFFDRRGQEMMDLFAQKWRHISAEEPNFESFPHDPVQAKSTLDHVFVLKNAIGDSFNVVYSCAIKTAASDHFLMSVSFHSPLTCQ